LPLAKGTAKAIEGPGITSRGRPSMNQAGEQPRQDVFVNGTAGPGRLPPETVSRRVSLSPRPGTLIYGSQDRGASPTPGDEKDFKGGARGSATGVPA